MDFGIWCFLGSVLGSGFFNWGEGVRIEGLGFKICYSGG